MKYIVERILAPDYGCEDRADDYVAMDRVVLKAEDGQEISKKIPDKELYDKDINEGDCVYFDSKKKILKA